MAQTYLDYQANLVICDREFHVFVDLAGLAWPSHYGNCSICSNLEKCHAGVGNGGIILVGNPSIVAENVALFRLNQSQQTIDR